MYVQLVELRVKPGRIPQFLEAFRINRDGTRKEPGNIQFDLLQAKDDDHKFIIYEVFRSAADLQVHRGTDHYKECVDRFGRLLEGERSIRAMVPLMAGYLDGAE